MPEDQDIDTKKGQMPTNLRLLYLMEEVAQMGTPVSASYLVGALGLPKPTVHRLLHTAEAEGFLQRDVDGKSYGPGFRLRRLATNTLSSQRIRTERLRIMRKLAEDVGETCNLAAPGRDGMVYLDRVETHWPLRIQLPVGSQVPFYCTASGKMYLSSLRQDKLERLLAILELEDFTEHTLTDPQALKEELSVTRARGYATDDQEFMDGMLALAVPICDDQGRLLSTLSIHVPNQRLDLENLLKNLPRLQEARDQLEDLVKV
ncbi:MAG: IclR family transcriptional regulator [Pseudomonadota bacterium]